MARDPATSQLGVAVQSHYFQVGPVVPWGEAGTGAVATQAMVNVALGPAGLELMRAGRSAPEALAEVLATDPDADSRQCAMVDAQGRAAAHTGSRCIAAAGHRLGAGYSVQANLMDRDTVWDAMAVAYESAGGLLAERMLAALDAAEAEGGDIRGRQSAAMLVLSGSPSGRPWADRLVDLRVEDHPEPLVELRRLLRLRRAFDASGGGEVEGHLRAVALAPEAIEIRFDAALGLAAGGDWGAAGDLFGGVVAEDPRWLETLRRLVAAGRVAADDAARLEAGLAGD